MVEISERYRSNPAPPWMRRTVERLLGSLAQEHLTGLRTIVLTDAASVDGGKTRRRGGRKYDRKDCLGFYYPAHRQGPAWIELVADNIIGALARPLHPIQLARDVVVARALFHEIGHHLHATRGSRGQHPEAGAEDWRLRLTRGHFQKQYWYLAPVARRLLTMLRFLRRRMTSQYSGPAGSRRSPSVR